MDKVARYIIGLGNPGEDYKNTRHNAGRMALEFFAKTAHFNEWKEDKKVQAAVSGGENMKFDCQTNSPRRRVEATSMIDVMLAVLFVSAATQSTAGYYVSA